VESFEKFWSSYPRRVAKGDARKAWLQTAKIRPPMPLLLAAVEAQKQSEQWLKDGGTFIPYPASWLRAERWDDELMVDLGAHKGGKPWHETASGIESKGRELGLLPEQFCLEDGRQDWQSFSAAVKRKAMRAA
jgi:hypothetical protein